MSSTFGQVLRELRDKAKLTQKELARRTGRADGSIISRLEKELHLPDPRFIQEMAIVLGASGIEQNEINQLWEAGGYHSTDIFAGQSAVVDPIIITSHQTLEKLDNDEDKELLVGWFQNGISFIQDLAYSRRLIQQTDWEKAGKELEKGRNKIERYQQNLDLLTNELSGDCSFNLGHFGYATDYYGSAVWATNDLGAKARLFFKLGDSYRPQGGDKWELAIDRYHQAEMIYRQLGDEVLVARCLRKIAGTRLYQGRPDEAKDILDQAYMICRRLGTVRELKKLHQHMAWVFFIYGKWDQAVQLCQEALDDVDDRRELIKGLLYLGDALRLARRVDEAESSYQKALELAKTSEKGLQVEIALIRLGLAKLYLKGKGREADARGLLNLALEAVRKRSEHFRVAEIIKEVGNLWLKLGRLEFAERYLEDASDRFKTLKNFFHYANTLALLCELYYKKKDFATLTEKAKLARELLNTDVDYHLNFPLARIEFIVGKSEIELNNFPDATKDWQKSLKWALEVNSIVFNEVVEGVTREILRVGEEISPKIAHDLSTEMANIVAKLRKASEQTELTASAVKSLKQLSRQLESLLPLHNLSNVSNHG